ncbi:telomere-binding alpha subunit central domain-containing [Trichoderma arundinaceum]|uniref:Protection of telomeres protein 1 n=1 Tax=Trichoderma arundinaceum TaxID=490622 RepID=A0A395N913_TRIAR|nr:telomere-binding alpha subunit central domain-containing [Trichoderma arundinaceum]
MAPLPNKRQNLLPSGFISVREILDHKRGVGNLLNVIGVVKDFRAPVPTRRSDWKCEIRLYDNSAEDDSSNSLAINIFRPENEMPNPRLGDVIVLYHAKLQSHAETLSLVTHWTTDIYIYAANQIPRPPEGAKEALRPQPRKTTQSPGQVVHEYVSFLYHCIDKSNLPTEAEFQDMKVKSTIVTEKFKQLKDVRDGIFADVVVQLVKQPYDTGDKITLWVSDFTENDSFFHFVYTGLGAFAGQSADPEGHLATLPFGADPGTGEWKGPFGKRSMQVTCFDPHTTVIRERGLSTGSWVMLRNLQIKYGRNAANLEGFLREDRWASSLKINIVQMDVTDTESPDPHLKEAVRRKREYEREKKDQVQGIFNAAMAGKKRKSDMAEMGLPLSDKPKKKNKNRSKARKRAAEQKSSSVVSTAYSEVKCEYDNKPISTIGDILDPVYIQTDVNGNQVKLQLPFVNVNYRANVRVVNFMPPDLEDFAQPKKLTEYDILSDSEESDIELVSEGEAMVDRATAREWEWRFFLELEDANPPEDDREKKKTLWVAVNNLSAQCLLSLDASDLQQDEKNLEALRQRLFLLWGELEEKKSLEEDRKYQAALANRELNRPPPNSSDDESGSPQKQDVEPSQISNRPFTCCIHQYGVQVPEENPLKADAGEGKRWQRMFGLFGTRIAYN